METGVIGEVSVDAVRHAEEEYKNDTDHVTTQLPDTVDLRASEAHQTGRLVTLTLAEVNIDIQSPFFTLKQYKQYITVFELMTEMCYREVFTTQSTSTMELFDENS